MTVLHTTELDLLERLGGTRVDVHRAVVRATGRVVVVKHAPRTRRDAAAAVAREAEVLERVRHRSLVRLLGRIEDRDGCGLVLAHAAGGALVDRLAVDGPMPPGEVTQLGAALADALAALHRAGLVHRDVHPGNVLLDAELVPLLADLEHARGHDTADCAAADGVPGDGRRAGQPEVVGHPDHVDPRLFAGAAPDARADLHGLATTLWRAATGSPPARPGPDAPVRFEPGVLPPALERVLTGCVTGSLVDAAAVASELRASALMVDRSSASGERPSPSAISVPGVAPRGTRRWRAPDLPPPPPPPPTPPAGTAAHGGRRVTTAAATLAVVAITAVGGAVVADRANAGAGEAGVPAPAVAPAPCDADPPAAGPGQSVLADLDGDGCSQWLALHDGVLSSPAGRHAFGEPGDLLLAGDWDGDGRWTPGLHRPSTGEVFLLDDPPGPTAVSAQVATSLRPGARAVVVDTGDGRHGVVAARP